MIKVASRGSGDVFVCPNRKDLLKPAKSRTCRRLQSAQSTVKRAQRGRRNGLGTRVTSPGGSSLTSVTRGEKCLCAPTEQIKLSV